MKRAKPPKKPLKSAQVAPRTTLALAAEVNKRLAQGGRVLDVPDRLAAITIRYLRAAGWTVTFKMSTTKEHTWLTLSCPDDEVDVAVTE